MNSLFKEEAVFDGYNYVVNCFEYLKRKYTDESKAIPTASLSPLRHFMNEFMTSGGIKLPFMSLKAEGSTETTYDHVFGTTRAVKKLYVEYLKNKKLDFENFKDYLKSHIVLIKITKTENQIVKSKHGSWVEKYIQCGIKVFLNQEDLKTTVNINELVSMFKIETVYLNEEEERKYFE